MRQRHAFLALLAAAASAGAQPVPIPPRIRPPAIPPFEVANPSRLARRLTDTELRTIGGRLEAFRSQVRAEAPRVDDFLGAGLEESTDVVEWARAPEAKGTETAHVALLVPLTAEAAEIDPALEEGARATLRARLGREPSAPELASEVAEFDSRIARLNASLAAKRPEISLAMRATGKFPRAMEGPMLGLPPAGAVPVRARTEERLQALIAELLLREAAPPP